MASIRELKKDVKSLCDSIQRECYVELFFGTSNEIELILGIMTRCDKLKSDTLHKMKCTNSMVPKERRKYFRQLTDNFYEEAMNCIKELNDHRLD